MNICSVFVFLTVFGHFSGHSLSLFWSWFCFCLGHAFPLLPTDTAWLFATRPAFLYPELLPVCSLDPGLHSQHHRSVYTAGEDGYTHAATQYTHTDIHTD